MAIIKAFNGGKSLSRAMNYAHNKSGITSGINCPNDKSDAQDQMIITKQIWDKEDGRQYKHYVQSFKPGEVSMEKAHELGREWAEKTFPGFEVFIGTHIDKEHIHNHFVINSVSFETGKKLDLSNADLKSAKKLSNEISEREGLTIPEKKLSRGDLNTFNSNKYRAIAKGNSYITDTAITINQVIEIAESKEEFIQEMNDRGYQVDWKDNRKNITFTDQEGHKVRSSNLAKTFTESNFSKEGISQKIEQNLSKNIQVKSQDRTITFTDEKGQAITASRENVRQQTRDR